MAILREGTEIFIYASSFIYEQVFFKSFLLGGFIGASIGISAGVLIYYLILSIQYKNPLFSIGVMAFISASMSSQAIMYLMQAGIINSQLPLWNSSDLISESSIPGQLLYAFIGYEATPTPLQVGVYTLILSIETFIIFWAKKSTRS